MLLIIQAYLYMNFLNIFLLIVLTISLILSAVLEYIITYRKEYAITKITQNNVQNLSVMHKIILCHSRYFVIIQSNKLPHKNATAFIIEFYIQIYVSSAVSA